MINAEAALFYVDKLKYVEIILDYLLQITQANALRF